MINLGNNVTVMHKTMKNLGVVTAVEKVDRQK